MGSLEPSIDDKVGGSRAFLGCAALNASVAVVVWVLLTGHFGEGVDSLAYHFGSWLLPVLLVLLTSAAAGVVCVLVPGQRRTGAGLLGAAATMAFVYALWSFAYFVGLGS